MLSTSDLEHLKNEITQRITAVTDEEKDMQYSLRSMVNTSRERGNYPEQKKKLYLAIRNRLKTERNDPDDKTFTELVDQLDNLKTTIKIKENELTKPAEATRGQKLYTTVFRAPNDAKKAYGNYMNDQTEISRLKILAKNIEELKEIYDEADENKNTTTEGGKRKSRRSRKSKKSKKSKQSRKNRRKSHHRRRR